MDGSHQKFCRDKGVLGCVWLNIWVRKVVMG